MSTITAAAVRSTMLTHSTSQPQSRKRSTCSIWRVWLLWPSAMLKLIFSRLSPSFSRARRSISWTTLEIKVSFC